MRFDSDDLIPLGLDSSVLELLIEEHVKHRVPHFERLWDYYRNDLTDRGLSDGGSRRYRLAQEQGLHPRLTQGDEASSFVQVQPRREIVIENDIAWRIHTLVDFMFGKAVVIQSGVADKERANQIEAFLHQVFESNGGVSFFQDMALLGSVYGHVDVLLRVKSSELANPGEKNSGFGKSHFFSGSERFVLELIDAPKSVPMLAPEDYRQLNAYVLHYHQETDRVETKGFLSRLLGGRDLQLASIERTQIWTDQATTTFEKAQGKMGLVDQAVNRLGRIPLVHIQNLPQPFFYEGLSEVEPLIPLQDELNTRLSDRANRVTFQSFKMYLGKGIDRFTDRPVGPGQMWSTDNLDASIEEFGGDSHNPSEDTHITEIREAMDKASAVPPVAAGLVRDKLGNLSSANALRITLMGLLAKTGKKRVGYGIGIQRLSELILHAADVFGVFPNQPSERGIRLDWPSMLPENESERLRDAQAKLKIGVPLNQVLAELGYADCVESV